MNNKRRGAPAWLALVIGALVWGACAAPPTEEMEEARQAVARAEADKDAAAYAPAQVTRARDLLAQMEGEAEAKNYEETKRYAAEAVAAADKAIADGKAAAARARSEAAELLSLLDQEIADTEDILAAAKETAVTTDLEVDFAALDEDLEFAETALEDARGSFNAEDYPAVTAKTAPIRPALSGIKTRLSTAAQAVSHKK